MTLNFSFLPDITFAFFLVFARVGAMVMVLPGIGDRTVSPRVRLIIGLFTALVILPVVQSSLPKLPTGMNELLIKIITEVLIGLAIGFAVRMIIIGLTVAGEFIAIQTGLAFAQSVDPSQGIQGTLIANFLSLLSVVLIFSANLHHLLLISIRDSYTVFPVGGIYPVEDFARASLKQLDLAFRLALQLAAPFLVFGLIFNLGIGILSKLIPQVQIFFISMPVNIFVGFILLMLLLGTMMTWYLEYFKAGLTPFLAPI